LFGVVFKKEKKRIHRRPLQVAFYHEGRVKPHSPSLLQASKDKLLDMATKDKERMMLEEIRNKLESYIYKVKNKLEDDLEKLSQVSTEEQRETCRKLALEAEEWMYEDGYNADIATMEEKFVGLSEPFEKILRRMSELSARPAAVEALKKRLTDIEQLMGKWATDRPQVTEEERTGVLEKVEDVRKWISEMEEAQAAKQPHEEPVFFSVDVPSKTKPVEAMVVLLSKRPKPKPKKNETKAEKATTANATASDSAGNVTAESAANATATEDGASNGAEKESTTREKGAAATGTTEARVEEGEEL
jgi:hypoxia up-regulated 1